MFFPPSSSLNIMRKLDALENHCLPSGGHWTHTIWEKKREKKNINKILSFYMYWMSS